ncbi:hypothetical protein [uncultured Arcobacter sp.]|uniref:hypothetical protein n=1 Tax=uncultured Arcobacter sp. TaxID=165434 RepID=UPI00263982D8|nr:hypothetical protein [uncultured Arcobacter sp.]
MSLPQFENMTIGQLQKIHEDYLVMEAELDYLKHKYPNAIKPKEKNADEILEEILEEGK